MKYNEKVIMDMEVLWNWKDLELKSQPNRKLLKPKANYNLKSPRS